MMLRLLFWGRCLLSSGWLGLRFLVPIGRARRVIGLRLNFLENPPKGGGPGFPGAPLFFFISPGRGGGGKKTTPKTFFFFFFFSPPPPWGENRQRAGIPLERRQNDYLFRIEKEGFPYSTCRTHSVGVLGADRCSFKAMPCSPTRRMAIGFLLAVASRIQLTWNEPLGR